MDPDYQRARKPEQIAERRSHILRVARDMLAQQRLADISLRELSLRVGLAKSNVLRYFESREGIYLELLDREWKKWLDEVEARSTTLGFDGEFAAEFTVAEILTDTLVAQPILCELFSSLAGVLEHNISVEYARTFKTRSAENAVRLREWVLIQLPGLDEASAYQFVGAVSVIAGGLWSYERPSDNIAQVTAEMGGLAAVGFSANLRSGLRAQLVGIVTLGRGRARSR